MSAHAERALLGALLFAPRLVPLCDSLSAADFISPDRAALFSELQDAAEGAEPIDCILLERRMNEAKHRPPAGTVHWFTALSNLVDEAIKYGTVDEEVVPEYVEAIKAAAAKRRILRLEQE